MRVFCYLQIANIPEIANTYANRKKIAKEF